MPLSPLLADFLLEQGFIKTKAKLQNSKQLKTALTKSIYVGRVSAKEPKQLDLPIHRAARMGRIELP